MTCGFLAGGASAAVVGEAALGSEVTDRGRILDVGEGEREPLFSRRTMSYNSCGNASAGPFQPYRMKEQCRGDGRIRILLGTQLTLTHSSTPIAPLAAHRP